MLNKNIYKMLSSNILLLYAMSNLKKGDYVKVYQYLTILQRINHFNTRRQLFIKGNITIDMLETEYSEEYKTGIIIDIDQDNVYGNIDILIDGKIITATREMVFKL